MITTILAGLLLASMPTEKFTVNATDPAMLHNGSLVISSATTQPAVKITFESDGDGNLTGPIRIARDWSDREACDLGAFAKAAREVAVHLEASTDLGGELAIYLSPAVKLRAEADKIEKRDTAILAFREQLAKCKWMAEPGAFDRKPKP